jgi:hypothetical protein
MPQLQWKGAPAPRARKIPQEIWEQYREELCEMYEKYTLDRLMTIMIEKHNFAASYVVSPSLKSRGTGLHKKY